VTDAVTGMPLPGATVRVRSTAIVTQTATDGRFELSNVPPGSFLLEVSLSGYTSGAFAVSAPGGGTIDFGLIKLTPGTPSATTGSVQGSAVDSLTGQPLRDVLVSISGADNRTAFTDVSGQFTISGVVPGAISLTASLDGYHQALGSATLVAGATVNFNVRLVKAVDPARVTVTGSVIDANALVPLSGVLVSVANTGRNVLTAADGSFQISNLLPGSLSVSFSLSGYNSLAYTVSAQSGGVVALGAVALARTMSVSGNRNPVITSKAPIQAIAGQTYAYNVVATDADGDKLTYALENYPSGMTIDATNGQVRWIPTIAQVGAQTFTVVVFDAQGGQTQEVAKVNVVAGGSNSYVITDVETLSGLFINDVVPNNYALGTYISGGSPGFVVGEPPCPLTFFTAGGSMAAALNVLERLTGPNSLGLQPAPGLDLILDMHQPFSTITVFPQIDHGPFPQEGIEYTVWGSNDPNAQFPAGWRLGTLMAIYRKGYTVSASCAGQNETDDFAGLYTFGLDSFRYVRVRSDFSITIFNTPAHTTWEGSGDDSGVPGWQSSEGEIDAVGGMMCDVRPTADAGSDIVGLTGQTIQFDGSGSQSNIVTYGWDLDGDGVIDLTGPKPTFVFNAGVDRDVTLMVVDNRGCVGVGKVHVTIGLNLPRPDLTVSQVVTDGVITDIQALQVTGSARITVQNLGRAAALEPALVTVFEDTNRNGIYDAGVDNTLGSLTMPSGLARGGSLIMDIPVNGMVAFRDSPLYAMVDSDRRIEEERENNNVATAASLCIVPPASRTFQPVLKWAWTGSSVLPTYDQAFGPLVVAPIEDTNGDGLINQLDVPAIIFSSYSSDNIIGDGVLRAISGKDGHDLWTVTNPAFRTDNLGAIAVGDIDNDGSIDIVATTANGNAAGASANIIAFERTGVPKWKSSVTSPFALSAIAIADLNSDGFPKIIVGNTVFNGDGSLLWRGTGFKGTSDDRNFFAISIVADIDLDGKPEVIAGASAYSNDGRLLWQNNVAGDGYAAVGNFNEDPYPEIVVVSRGRVSLLNHLGEIIWGPIQLPGGEGAEAGRNLGGAPTIADMDGDGIPEIGIAMLHNYVVLKADGSILWTSAPTEDNSGVTGSAVFDFDGDGRAEVVYADERNLYVFRGADGALLLKTPNTNGTAIELPIVADVDGDGHADIAVAANAFFQIRGIRPGPSQNGIRVFQDQNNSWLATRKIWNQHSYHITNINDDGTVPRVEQNSWQVHNTYRLNAIPGFNPAALADLTVSALKLTASASGQPVGVSARVGNAGAAASGATTVVFYEGNPSAGGVLLGTVAVGTLQPGEYKDVTLTPVPNLTGTADLYAVVDSGNQIAECRETNNTAHRVVQTQSLFGDIVVGTNASTYGANSPVTLQVSVVNTSALPGAFRVQVQVEDNAGAVLAAFGTKDIGTLPGGGAVNLTEAWNTNGYLAGTYRVRGKLFSLGNALLDEAVATFAIKHDPSGASAVTLRTTTDRTTYYTTDRVTIEDLIGNVSSNTLVSGATLRVVVRDPSGQVVLNQDLPLAEFAPGSLRSLLLPHVLTAAAIGIYQIQASVLEAGGLTTLASAQASFQVVNDLAKALQGSVEVALLTLEVGQTQTCTDRTVNTGTVAATGLELHHELVNVDTSQLVADQVTAVDVGSGLSNVHVRGIVTDRLPAGNYACVLQARINGDLKTLAFTPFVLVQPPIKFTSDLHLGAKGRLLVLLDNGRHGHEDDAGEHQQEHNTANDDRDPHGPIDGPGLAAQRAFLEKLLKGAGWSYTITDTADAFTREFHSGGYSVYALFTEDEKLSEQTQKELREAIFRGEGLVVAGVHDNRNLHRKRLNDALGLKVVGHLSHAEAVVLTASDLGLTGEIPLIPGDKALRVKRLTAISAGIYRLGADNRIESDDADDCRKTDDDKHLAKSSNDNKDQDDEDQDEECEANPVGDLDAVTLNAYGRGQSAFTGFDLLAQATRDGDTSLAAQLLAKLLTKVNPASLATGPGAVVPIELTLKNQGVAVSITATVTLPPGVSVIDVGTGQASGQLLTWTFPLAVDEQKSVTAWIRLPDQSGPVTLNATVIASAGSTSLTANPTLTINVTSPEELGGIKATLEALVQADHPDKEALARAIDRLAKAINNTDSSKAIVEALRATDALLGLTDPIITSLRVSIDTWLQRVARYAYN
jgi:hypothetical protein